MAADVKDKSKKMFGGMFNKPKEKGKGGMPGKPGINTQSN